MNSLETALEIITKATWHDGEKRAKEAAYLYALGVVFLKEAHAKSGDPALLGRVEQYQTRCNQLGGHSFQRPNVPSQSFSSRSFVSSPPAIDWSSIQQAEKEKNKINEVSKDGTAPRRLFTDIDLGMKNAEMGTAEDIAGNYDAALEYYKAACNHFFKALEVERNPETKRVITEKMNEYLSRAEILKELRDAKAGKLSSKKPSTKSLKKMEVSSAAAPHLDRAITLATEGTDEDESTRFQEAIEKYQQAIEAFSLALKYETNETVKAMIRDKMVDYNARTEKLKQYVKSGEFMGSGEIPLASKSGEKYEPPPVKKSSGIFKKEKKTWKT